jgi:hypothetical protein
VGDWPKAPSRGSAAAQALCRLLVGAARGTRSAREAGICVNALGACFGGLCEVTTASKMSEQHAESRTQLK